MSGPGYSGLSLDQAPPLSAPLRFFLTAPLFGMAAAVLMAISGPDIFISRWSPQMLALTHLITLGFISMAMLGAVQQLLPVLAGSPIARPVLIGAALHLLLTIGAALLAAGFLHDNEPALIAALLALAVCMGLFLVVTMHCLFTAKAESDSVAAMRLSATSLAVAVVAGVCIVLGRMTDPLVPAHAALTDIHPVWALSGWVGLMFIGVGYKVAPMFQLTPGYPKPVTAWLVRAIFGLLLLYSGVRLIRPGFASWLLPALPACFVVFAIVTLSLQGRRRRRIPDVTLDFWRLGMFSILAVAALWAVQLSPSPVPAALDVELVIGIVILIGVVVSLITGMLYKIIPFLLWFHLQSRLDEYVKLPSMKEMLPDKPARRQLHVHMISLAMLIMAAALPSGWTLYPAALLFAASCLMLLLNIVAACRLYRTTCIMLDNPGD